MRNLHYLQQELKNSIREELKALKKLDKWEKGIGVRSKADGTPVFNFGGNCTQFGCMARSKGVALSSEGYIFVVDAKFGVVQIFDQEKQLLLNFGGFGTGPGQMILPAGIHIDIHAKQPFAGIALVAHKVHFAGPG